MTLYNCHTDGDQYRITKFDTLGNVESSYLCTETECECPAGQRPTCRHRQMLPTFIRQKMVDSHAFYNFDTKTWVGVDIIPPLPEGIQVLTLDDPETVHNTIAKAVGEPPMKRRI